MTTDHGIDILDDAGQLGRLELHNPESAKERPAVPYQIDVPLVRSCIKDCRKNHRDCVQRHASPRTESARIETWLVDTQNKCLAKHTISGGYGVSYVALSYVWGHTAMLQTVHSNLTELQTPGALDSGEHLVAPVIQDAMVLARALGYQYLLVDALCIVQDVAEKGQLLEVMDLIYMIADLTIFAMAGEDANFRLPGVLPGTRVQQPVAMIDGNMLNAALPEWTDEQQMSCHFTRGWTYEEMILSPRRLFISPYQAYFRCNTSQYSEKPPVHTTLGNDIGLSELHVRRMLNYERFVEAYTSRILAYDSDILNAFSGIIQFLSATYLVEFYTAMPTGDDTFRALFWTSTSTCPSRRSRARGLSAKSDIYLPSLSWTGWKGAVKYPELGPAEFLRPACGLLLSATLLAKCAGDTELRKTVQTLKDESIEAGYCGRGCCVSLGDDDTLGNTQLEASDGSGPSTSNGRNDIRKYGAPALKFDRAMPLAVLQVRVSMVMACKFRFGKIELRSIPSKYLENVKWLPLYDASNAKCGGLYSTNAIRFDRLQNHRLIALSLHRPFRYFATGGFYDTFFEIEEPAMRCKCLLHIMLVEQIGSRAERIDIGCMLPKAWANASPTLETINLA
ncbi:hypothetical protein BO94DRAFT_621467 [Aspergillus sclerotioniger CBS 115572]|uniref:Heterokaryon incompatibility domain-containing protein n=1 Tax=Aspergillus sclerotioniger CBS 115572 TaxID=1450535 RepID=A0A317X5W9_9EURO|nr:hypothetical protein BO94DRAFT_621467 [Aspergillus sclerotioniger CBS 115572]PWY94004.1 hypothetical protein BO94DRAFT_621467 [Aspergillus sclerotioniger CBS 115572]